MKYFTQARETEQAIHKMASFGRAQNYQSEIHWENIFHKMKDAIKAKEKLEESLHQKVTKANKNWDVYKEWLTHTIDEIIDMQSHYLELSAGIASEYMKIKTPEATGELALL